MKIKFIEPTFMGAKMRFGRVRHVAGSLIVAGIIMGTSHSAQAQATQVPFTLPGGGTGTITFNPTTGVLNLATTNGFTATGNFNPATGAFTVTSNGCTFTGNINTPSSFSFSPAGCFGGAAFGGGTAVSVRGTLPLAYIATAQQYFAVSQLGQDAQHTSQVTLGAVNTVITNIRDSIELRRPRGGNSFAWDPYADNSLVDSKNDPFAKFATYGESLPGALGYAKSPIYTKAVPTPAPSGVLLAVWGQGFADQENRTQTFLGTDVGRMTTTYGGLAGFDAQFSNWLGFGGTYVIGVLGGYTQSNVRNADGSTSRVQGPGTGIYSVWTKGGWSIDSVFKVDFFGLDRWQTGLAALTLGLTNYTYAGDINYRFYLPQNWWIEPTAGISYTSTRWDTPSSILGFQNGEALRVQGGTRIGTSTTWGNTTVEGSLSGLVYSDVVINGGTLAVVLGTPLVPTDQGKVFGQGIGKLNFIWTPQISSYIEGEVRGRDGVIGYAGRIGARYSFQ
jgi:hypothetical protein